MDGNELQRKVDDDLDQIDLKSLGANGEWHWPDYGVTRITAVVLGHRHLTSPEGWIEVVYAMTIHSMHAIPHAGHGGRLPTKNGGYFTFSQLANSVYTTSHSTQIVTTYMGSNPPPPPRPP